MRQRPAENKDELVLSWIELVNPVWLIAMLMLATGSAFFSCSEAALFYLTPEDRRLLASGNRWQRVSVRLLRDPDRLLTAVLFWNLLINVTYFAVSSIVSLRLEGVGHRAEATEFALLSLLLVILFSEMLPKSLGVSQSRWMASLLGVPLGVAVRVLDPIMTGLRVVNLLSRRLVWPGFKPEPYLEVEDLERAVRLSTSDAALREQEQIVLQNILALSQISAEEMMRPRRWLKTQRPPVALADLGGELPPSGYVFVTEPDSDELAAAIPLMRMAYIPETHLEFHAEKVVYVPWSASVATAMDTMRGKDRRVAAVINELGETIGALTFDDILDTIFSPQASRSSRLLQREPILQVGPNTWHVVGMTTLRRLAAALDVELPPSKSVTVAGVVQELLERLPTAGDRCTWGPLEFHVLEVSERGQLLVEVTRRSRTTEGDRSR